MPLDTGIRLGAYEIIGPLGAGGPASARGERVSRVLWRGLAAAHQKTRC